MTALHGMFLETVFLTPVAIGWLIYGGAGNLQSITAVDWTLLVLAGPMTTIPLLLFAYAAPRTSLINMGMFQFFAPSIALMIGWQIYREDMPAERWVAFGMVWVSLIIYMSDMIRKRRALQNAVAKPVEPSANRSSVGLPVARPEVISSK